MSSDSSEPRLMKIMPFPAFHACACESACCVNYPPSQTHRLANVTLYPVCINIHSRYVSCRARRSLLDPTSWIGKRNRFGDQEPQVPHPEARDRPANHHLRSDRSLQKLQATTAWCASIVKDCVPSDSSCPFVSLCSTNSPGSFTITLKEFSRHCLGPD